MKTKQHIEDDRLLSSLKESITKLISAPGFDGNLASVFEKNRMGGKVEEVKRSRSLFELADRLRLGRSATRAAVTALTSDVNRMRAALSARPVGAKEVAR